MTREVPTDYAGLRAAVEQLVFPAERHWIDFKSGLYPRRPGDESSPEPSKKERAKAHIELARDLASMAIRGGYLVYGVAEHRPTFSFEPVEMPLEKGVRETVTSVALDRISPALEVQTYVLASPDRPGFGFLVVEIPESRDAPHMVEGVFYGRSDTGRTTLHESDVERLILQRVRLLDHLADAMALTMEHDPGDTARGEKPRLLMTAVPTRGLPDMFRRFTLPTTPDLVHRHLRKALQLAGQIMESDGVSGHLPYSRRGQRISGLWLRDWEVAGPERDPYDRPVAGEALGISDHGELRWMWFRAGNPVLQGEAEQPSAMNPRPRRADAIRGILNESAILRSVLAMIRLIGEFTQTVSYTGSWLIGVQIDNLAGYVSEQHQYGLHTTPTAFVQILDGHQHCQTVRASARELLDQPGAVVAELTRALLRDLDREDLTVSIGPAIGQTEMPD